MPTGISSGLKSVLAAVSASVTTAPPAIAAQRLPALSDEGQQRLTVGGPT